MQASQPAKPDPYGYLLVRMRLAGKGDGGLPVWRLERAVYPDLKSAKAAQRHFAKKGDRNINIRPLDQIVAEMWPWS